MDDPFEIRKDFIVSIEGTNSIVVHYVAACSLLFSVTKLFCSVDSDGSGTTVLYRRVVEKGTKEDS